MKNYKLDTKVNNDMFILYEDDKELMRISKRANTLEKVKAFLKKIGLDAYEII